MKYYLTTLLVCITLFNGWPALRAESRRSSQVANEFSSLSSEEVLARLHEGGWLKLPALSEVTGDESRNLEMVASAVLKALAHEARTLRNLTEPTTLLDRTLRVAAVSQIAASQGGYLNDLIAASADQVFLLGAWTIIDRSPKLAPKLLWAVEARGKLSTPKAWFMDRYKLDPDLVTKKDELNALKPDASGWQAVVALQTKGRDASNLPTVFEQITTPEIDLLWWTIYTTDYRIVVLRAGIAYVEAGGEFTQNVNDFRARCTLIWGNKRLPFTHELKRGSIYPEDIWDNWNSARDASVHQRQIEQWFGKP